MGRIIRFQPEWVKGDLFAERLVEEEELQGIVKRNIWIQLAVDRNFPPLQAKVVEDNVLTNGYCLISPGKVETVYLLRGIFSYERYLEKLTEGVDVGLLTEAEGLFSVRGTAPLGYQAIEPRHADYFKYATKLRQPC